ncbi:MAG TPA: hypothetical protein VG796_28980 [Verrucomicrobiales bacterium]|nr:hypothetical protein [Verrucomicrobiales bacterium]
MRSLVLTVLGIAVPGLLGFEAARQRVTAEREEEAAKHNEVSVTVETPRKESGKDPSPELRVLSAARAGSDAALAAFAEAAGRKPGDFARALFEFDPAGTLAFIDGLTDRARALEIVMAILEYYPASRLLQLGAWATRQPPGKFRSAVVGRLMPFWVLEDSKGAIDAALALGESPGAAEARRKLLQQLPVRQKLTTVPRMPVSEQLAFLKEAGAEFSRTLPEQATAAIAALPVSPARSQAIGGLCKDWAARDPVAAAAAVASLSDSTLQVAGLQSIAETWSSIDPVRAGTWVNTLAAGPLRDAAAAGIAKELSRDRLDAAMAWAASISDPAARSEAEEAAKENWREKNPQAPAGAEKQSVPNNSGKPSAKPP